MGLNMNQPTVVTTDENAVEAIYDNIPEDCVVGYILRVVAASDGGYAHWEKRFIVRRIGDADPIIDGLCDLFPPMVSLGATDWVVNIYTDSADVIVSVQGSADTQVFWFLESFGDEIPTLFNDRMSAQVGRPSGRRILTTER